MEIEFKSSKYSNVIALMRLTAFKFSLFIAKRVSLKIINYYDNPENEEEIEVLGASAYERFSVSFILPLVIWLDPLDYDDRCTDSWAYSFDVVYNGQVPSN
ncbi:hypothetical protein [Marinagarivorans cellulosilyticus]|uniref:Uncharacterized protein n=1 Tax=Marinagarivorans cellulosilyticus TaxID=2721545 RepID=A0AAN1WHG2_9GAMM|nr:hypothetical protein [Marinagarivorans cellulosilyticus]BCD97690.1 hypothetical protein MARGE09_P1891 [Marinagarivorans cellulosilyticus]